MASPKQLLEILAKQDSIELLTELNLILVYFYGSRAKERSHEASDYDFAVMLDDRKTWSYLEKVERLDKFGEWMANALGVERDLIDVQDLDEMPVSVAFHAVGDGLLLWESEPGLGVCFRRQTYSKYQDFEYAESIFADGLRRRLLGEKKVG